MDIPYYTQAREYGADTWGPNARQNGGANCWAGMALDEKEVLYTSLRHHPRLTFMELDRPGQNLFGNCLLALDANTGKRI